MIRSNNLEKGKKKALGSQGTARFHRNQTTVTDKSRTIYVGNLDRRVTEYMIIKLFEPFGTITRENFVWHTTGENRGAPRGYAFVEYRTKEACAKAQKAMDGKLCLGRRIAVRFAHQDDDNDKSMSDRNALKGKESSIMSTADKIRAIEEKLKRMQGKSKSKSAKDTSTSSEKKPQEEVKASKSVEDKDSIAADNVRSSSTRKIKTAKRNVRVKPY